MLESMHGDLQALRHHGNSLPVASLPWQKSRGGLFRREGTTVKNAAKLLALFDRLLCDDRIVLDGLSPEQRTMLKRIRGVLAVRAEKMPRLLNKRVIS